jgi:hypothetical protein
MFTFNETIYEKLFCSLVAKTTLHSSDLNYLKGQSQPDLIYLVLKCSNRPGVGQWEAGHKKEFNLFLLFLICL